MTISFLSNFSLFDCRVIPSFVILIFKIFELPLSQDLILLSVFSLLSLILEYHHAFSESKRRLLKFKLIELVEEYFYFFVIYH